MNQTLKSFFLIAKSNLNIHKNIVRDFGYFLKSLGISDSIIALEDDLNLTKEQIKKINIFFSSYINGLPLDYILEESVFYGNNFFVDPRVLIPRQETELIVDWALELELMNNSVISEVGTGSGCIAISIALQRPKIKIIASDISSPALEVASKNIEFYNLKNISLIQSSFISFVKDESIDLVISNPPYINSNDPHLKDLMHEPKIALISNNGAKIFFEIASQAINVLKKGGKIIFEHGFKQAGDVSEILKECGFKNILSKKDLQGIDRYTHAEKI